jgi:preprotein translocase subunit SecF
MELLQNTNINFVGRMKYAFGFSLLLILIGAASLIGHGGPHLSIDFTGGTVLQVKIEPPASTAEVRLILQDAGFAGAQVQDFGHGEHLINYPGLRTENEDVPEQLRRALADKLSDATVTSERQETVGPKIGGELRTAAMNSIVAALILIILYITVRFIFRYGVAAILALVHDVMITLGVFSLLNKEISLSIIAAFLTIIGYSLNDTIVVFDRIRENMRLRRRESYRDVINRSINETLSRTLLTSGTTLLVAGALYALGGPVIHDFAFALCFGVIIGTYSSIFIASPILVWWTEKRIIDRKRTQPSM